MEENYQKRISELESELKKHKKDKEYGLVWEDKPEQFDFDLNNSFPILKPKSDLNYPDIGAPDSTRKPHILIEGDNYHALTVLSYTHHEAVDVIYIDPPYNTGKKDFKYNDNFVDKEDSFRHSKWLSFISKRLKIARELLKESGVIFISIDDNEQANLKVLCDEIFGERNFISMFIHKNNSSKNQASLVSISTEYVLAYKKSARGFLSTKWRVKKKGADDIVKLFNRLKKDGVELDIIDSEIKDLYKRPKYSHLNRWNKVDEHGVFKDADLSRQDGPKDYTIINPHTGKQCAVPERGWGKSHDELLKLQQDNLIWYGADDTAPGLKDYIGSDDESVPDSFLYFDNSVDTRTIKEMFGSLAFNNPKPIEMIKMLINMSSSSSATILDFFAGSGTTGHAVLDLNKEDDGNRQFILCTNNEENICEDITYTRLRKVIEGYSYTKKKKSEILTIQKEGLGGSLKYLKTAFVPREKADQTSDQDRLNLTYEIGTVLAFKESTFNEIKRESHYQIYESFTHITVIYFSEDTRCFSEVELYLSQTTKLCKLYVFSWSIGLYQDEFLHLSHVTVEDIPEPILAVYKNVGALK